MGCGVSIWCAKKESPGCLRRTTDGEAIEVDMWPAWASACTTAPSWLRAVMFHSPNILATAECFLSSAIIIGERSMLSTIFLLAKHSKSSLTASMCPSRAAKYNGLCPCKHMRYYNKSVCVCRIYKSRTL